MPRAKTILQDQFPYHISGRCQNKEWFQIPMEEVWQIFCRQLTFISWAYDVKIHSFVLMSNHFHLLLSTPNANLDKAMANFMRETSRFINESSGRINQSYGSRHFRSVISSPHYFLHAYKYIYQNPVRAGIVRNCEDYTYSSLKGLIGLQKLDIPLVEDTTLFSDTDGVIKWLNTKPETEDFDSVKEAMYKSKFKLRKDLSSKRENRLEHARF